MPDSPVDNARLLLAREGVSASEAELERLAVMVALRRRIDPRPETEPQLTLVSEPWKTQ